MAAHELIEEDVGVVLVSPELRAAFAPGVGMVGYSLLHRGEELLGQRGGLAAYRERASTFGIPLLHPWANRLSGLEYAVAGRRVELDPGRSPIHFEGGLPIHGLLAAAPYWRVAERTADDGRAALTARLDFGAHEELLAGFPFPHELEVMAELADHTLTVTTTVRPTGDAPVPVSFGWHPYLTLPGVPRADLHVELPVRSQAVLDERGLPTGAVEPIAIEPGPLGDRTWDDLFPQLEHPAVFALEGGGRRIEVELGEGYSLAQVFAPPGERYVCYEPMTAPTNALVTGERLRIVEPGDSFRAQFAVRVR